LEEGDRGHQRMVTVGTRLKGWDDAVFRSIRRHGRTFRIGFCVVVLAVLVLTAVTGTWRLWLRPQSWAGPLLAMSYFQWLRAKARRERDPWQSE
jgi:hypothetical protein